MKQPPSDLLIGPAAQVLDVARELVRDVQHGAILLDGSPGTGKTAALDQLAWFLTRSAFAIEHVNGQSLGIDVVRRWRERGPSGNLFASKTVKRIDELDQASPSGMAELLSLLDYMPSSFFVLATTNEYAKLRALTQGRLETRFNRFTVAAPTILQTARLLMRRHKLKLDAATAIARGAVPDGCLETEGCNVRAALKDAESYLAARRTIKPGRSRR